VSNRERRKSRPSSQPAAAAPDAGQPAPPPRRESGSRFRTLAWALGAALATALIWRAAKFQPEPLDGAHTLRPVLLAVYNRVLGCYRNPGSARVHWLMLCYAAVLVPPALALWSCWRAAGGLRVRGIAGRIAGSRVALFASVGFGLLVCRFPLLLQSPSNPDESQFLAAAHKLFYDPVFFRALDCGSTGPFNIFPLMLPALAGISPDYATGRLIAILIIFFSLYFLYRAFAQVSADSVARLAILPAFGFFCLVANADFVHYSSEHVSLLLVSLALFACLRCVREPRRHGLPLVGLGALVATAYFAKQQSVPMIAAAAAVAAACVYARRAAGRWWRPIALLAAGFAPLPLLNALICAATGTWHDFLTVYVFGNMHYAQGSLELRDELPQFAAFLPGPPETQYLFLAFLAVGALSVYRVVRRGPKNQFLLLLETGGVGAAIIFAAVRFVSAGGLSAGWLCALGWFACAAAVAFLAIESFDGERARFWLGLLTVAVLAASVFSIYRAHHMFTHYLLLLAIPLSAAMGWMLDRQLSCGAAEAPRLRLPFVLLFLTVLAGCWWHLLPGLSTTFQAGHPETMDSPEGRFIGSLTRPGPTLAVWGWYADLYVRAGRPPALRDAVIGNEFVSQPAGEYARHRFLDDMRRFRPEMFVDALALSCCNFANPRNRFEGVPDIKTCIDSNYILVADRWNMRFFLRRDLAAARGAPNQPARGGP